MFEHEVQIVTIECVAHHDVRARGTDCYNRMCILQILAYVNKVREVGCSVNNAAFTLEEVESTPVRCPDPEAAELMYQGVRFAQFKPIATLTLIVTVTVETTA